MNQTADNQPSIANAVAALVGGRQPLNYFTHLDFDLGFIYLATPLVANVRTVGSLNLAVAQANGVGFSYSKVGQVFNRQFNLVGNPHLAGFEVFNQMLEDPRVIKLTFTRDPVERFAATYRNSFSFNMRGAEPRKKLFAYLGISDNENLSMLDLAELIAEESEIKSLLPQLKSQRTMTAYDLIDYDFIGRHENWSDDFSKIADEIFGRNTSHFDPVKMFNQDPEGVEVYTLVEPDAREAIKTAYAEDYEMLEEITEHFPDGFALHTD